MYFVYRDGSTSMPRPKLQDSQGKLPARRASCDPERWADHITTAFPECG